MPFYKIPISEMWVICLIFDVCLRLRVKKKPRQKVCSGICGWVWVGAEPGGAAAHTVS